MENYKKALREIEKKRISRIEAIDRVIDKRLKLLENKIIMLENDKEKIAEEVLKTLVTITKLRATRLTLIEKIEREKI